MHILSKGSDIPFVNESIKWGESTNFKDFDVVFVNLMSLEKNADNYDHPYNESDESPKMFDYMDVTEFMKTGGQMVVYLPKNPIVNMGNATTEKEKNKQPTATVPMPKGSKLNQKEDTVDPYTEYELLSWLPFSVSFDDSESGVSIEKVQEAWKWYFGERFNWDMMINGPGYDSNYNTHPIAKNSYDSDISIKATNKYSDDGFVSLIPPKFDISYSDFVNKTLDEVFDVKSNVEGRSPPTWVSDCKLPGEERIEVEIEKKKEEIEELDKELDDITSSKRLLYETNEPLEQIVRDSLRELGFKVEDEVPGKRDGILYTSEINFAIEVTGTTGGIKLSKARQLDDWVENVTVEFPDEEVSGLLIVNSEMNTNPEDRDVRVEPNVENYMEQRGNYKILTTIDLYEMVKLALSEEVDKDSLEQMFYQDETLLTRPDDV